MYREREGEKVRKIEKQGNPDKNIMQKKVQAIMFRF